MRLIDVAPALARFFRKRGGELEIPLRSFREGTLDQPRILANDAIVVLCLRDMVDSMSSHKFKARARAKGFELTKSQCHNMLHRAMGRVWFNKVDGEWLLTAMGWEYRREVAETLKRILVTVA